MAFVTKIRRVRFQATGYTGDQMAAAGREMIDGSLVPRIRAGQTIYDQPAPPLKQPPPGSTAANLNLPAQRYYGYPAQKIRRGLKPIRDWTLTGRTLRSMKVLDTQPNRGRIGFTDSITNMRAAINNARVRQFGFGRGDYPKLGAALARQGPFVRAVVTG